MKKTITLLGIILILPSFIFGQWTQVGADIDGEVAGDWSGYSVDLSDNGNVLAIGARENDDNGTDSGHVRVFEWTGSIWNQIGLDIDGEAAGDNSGFNLSLNNDGSILAIGAWRNDGNSTDSGHVRVFEWTGSIWNQIGTDIDGEFAEDRSGWSVNLSSDGTKLAVGAPWNNGNGSRSGHVRVFEWTGSIWNQIGTDIDGEATEDQSGITTSLSSDGSVLAIGAWQNDGNGTDSGHVRVFEWTGSIWNQIGTDIDGEAVGDSSGISTSLSSDGSILAIGALYNDGNGTNSGHVRVFEWTGSIWDQIGTDIDGEAANDWFGRFVRLSNNGSILAIGAILNGGSNSGHVRVFEWTGSIWDQIGSDIDGEASGDLSGLTVSLNSDGSSLAVGAYQNDGNGSNSGHVRVFNNPSLSITTNNFGPQFKAYPNPSFERANIELGSYFQEVRVTVFDLLGKEVMHKTYNNTNNIELDTQKFTAGVYIVKVEAYSNKASLKLVVK